MNLSPVSIIIEAGDRFIYKPPNTITNAITPKAFKARLKLFLASHAFYSTVIVDWEQLVSVMEIGGGDWWEWMMWFCEMCVNSFSYFSNTSMTFEMQWCYCFLCNTQLDWMIAVRHVWLRFKERDLRMILSFCNENIISTFGQNH